MKENKILHNRLFRAALYNLFAFLIFNWIFHPYFETNDDNLMALISDGAMAGYSSHLVFINIIYGRLLVLLHTICPDVNWYGGLLFLIVYLSFTAVTYIWLKLKPGKKGVLISILFLSWFGYYTYVVMQFTRVAGIAASAGFLLIFYGLDREKGRKKILLFIAGALLSLTGGLLRFNMFVLCAAILAGLGLWKVIGFYRNGGIKGAVNIWKYLIPYLVVLVMGAVLNGVDTAAYDSDEEWKEYREYNDLRSELLDYGFPDYQENKQTYEKLGITEKDIEYYETWNFADPEKFSKENLETLVALKPHREINLGFFIDFVWEMVQGLFYEKTFILFGVVFLLFCTQWKKNLLPLGFTAFMILIIQMYFYYQGRYLFERVDMPIWFAATCFLVYTSSLDISKDVLGVIKYWSVVVLVFILNGEVYLNNILSEPDPDIQREQKEMLDQMSQDEDTLYCTNVSSLEQAYDIQNRMEEGSMGNVYFLGSWLYKCPLTEQVKDKYGVDNPFKECIDDPDILIVDTKNAEGTEQYIQRNYNESARLYKVKDILGQSVYQVITDGYKVQEKAEKPLEEDIVYQLEAIRLSDQEVKIQGYLFKENTDSFSQRFYVRVTDRRSGKVSYIPGLQTENPDYHEERNGRYSGIDQMLSISVSEQEFMEIEVILETEDGFWYSAPVEII